MEDPFKSSSEALNVLYPAVMRYSALLALVQSLWVCEKQKESHDYNEEEGRTGAIVSTSDKEDNNHEEGGVNAGLNQGFLSVGGGQPRGLISPLLSVFPSRSKDL